MCLCSGQARERSPIKINTSHDDLDQLDLYEGGNNLGMVDTSTAVHAAQPARCAGQVPQFTR